MAQIKNILFDLGGVLINLDLGRTEAAFRALVGDGNGFRRISESLHRQALFRRFETGDLSAAEFVQAIQAVCPYPVADAQVRTAWSAMLLDLPAARIDLLRELRRQGYRLFLLSNINEIHHEDFRLICQSLDLDFDALFERVYYSHLIGSRKPDAAAFRHVLADADIQARETLFVDDLPENLHGAAALGIQTLWQPANTDTEKRLKTYLNL